MTTHHLQIAIVGEIPEEIDAGLDVVLNIRVSCADGCDLRGARVVVLAGDDVSIARELASFADGANETGDFAVRTPDTIGDHAWTILFARHETDSVVHEECRSQIVIATKPHEASMAVWDAPSPIPVGRPFAIKVGVRCSAACELGGRRIVVCDEDGAEVGQGQLGESPWPGTSALHVALVQLKAPEEEGIVSWSAMFPADGPSPPHEDARATFTFRSDRTPAHRVTVHVADKDTRAPVEQVDVWLGQYRASTDARGLACLELPAGTYDLDGCKVGYEVTSRKVEVSSDFLVEVDAVVLPERNADDERVWM